MNVSPRIETEAEVGRRDRFCHDDEAGGQCKFVPVVKNKLQKAAGPPGPGAARRLGPEFPRRLDSKLEPGPDDEAAGTLKHCGLVSGRRADDSPPADGRGSDDYSCPAAAEVVAMIAGRVAAANLLYSLDVMQQMQIKFGRCKL